MQESNINRNQSTVSTFLDINGSEDIEILHASGI